MAPPITLGIRTDERAPNYVIFLAEVVTSKVDPRLTPVAWLENKYFALTDEIR